MQECQELQFAVRKSQILTSRPIKQTNSAPILPPLAHSQPSSPKRKNVIIASIKTRQQLINEQRYRDLIRLKVSLNTQHIQQNEQRQKIRQRVPLDKDCVVDYVRKMQKQLENMICKTEQPVFVPKQIDYLKLQFQRHCGYLQGLNQVINKEKNMHFRNKIVAAIEVMKNRDELMQLYNEITAEVDMDQLYVEWKPILEDKERFGKELKMIAVQCETMITNYEKHRYRYLNDNIERRKREMSSQGRRIGIKLKQVQNVGIRQGIYGSLKNIHFNCIANRNMYIELTDRVQHMNP